MTAINRSNYLSLLPSIKEEIKNASFVAFDAEFSGLQMPTGEKANSLFDNGPLRYSKLREVINYNSAPQMGISIVTRDPDPSANKYYVKCYVAYVMEPSFAGFRSKENSLTLCFKSGKFLRECGFDFNALVKDSIPCLNENRAKELEEYVRKHPDFMKTHGSRYFDNIFFPEVKDMYDEQDIQDLVKRMKGFSEIADAIREFKIPIVGHNMSLDLLHFIKMLGCDLPETYEQFKFEVKRLLPHVYDTKFMVGACRRSFCHHTLKNEKEKLKDSGLYVAYFMTSSASTKFDPEIVLDPGSQHFQSSLIRGKSCNLESTKDDLLHNPAFDSCLTSIVFLNLGILSAKVETRFDSRVDPPTMNEIFTNFTPWEGQIYLAWAAIKAMNLLGDDPRPATSQPPWILVDFSSSPPETSSEDIKAEFKKYGPVEEQKLSKDKSRFATTNFKSFFKIRDDLRRCRIKFTQEKIEG